MRQRRDGLPFEGARQHRGIPSGVSGRRFRNSTEHNLNWTNHPANSHSWPAQHEQEVARFPGPDRWSGNGIVNQSQYVARSSRLSEYGQQFCNVGTGRHNTGRQARNSEPCMQARNSDPRMHRKSENSVWSHTSSLHQSPLTVEQSVSLPTSNPYKPQNDSHSDISNHISARYLKQPQHIAHRIRANEPQRVLPGQQLRSQEGTHRVRINAEPKKFQPEKQLQSEYATRRRPATPHYDTSINNPTRHVQLPQTRNLPGQTKLAEMENKANFPLEENPVGVGGERQHTNKNPHISSSEQKLRIETPELQSSSARNQANSLIDAEIQFWMAAGTMKDEDFHDPLGLKPSHRIRNVPSDQTISALFSELSAFDNLRSQIPSLQPQQPKPGVNYVPPLPSRVDGFNPQQNYTNLETTSDKQRPIVAAQNGVNLSQHALSILNDAPRILDRGTAEEKAKLAKFAMAMKAMAQRQAVSKVPLLRNNHGVQPQPEAAVISANSIRQKQHIPASLGRGVGASMSRNSNRDPRLQRQSRYDILRNRSLGSTRVDTEVSSVVKTEDGNSADQTQSTPLHASSSDSSANEIPSSEQKSPKNQSNTASDDDSTVLIDANPHRLKRQKFSPTLNHDSISEMELLPEDLTEQAEEGLTCACVEGGNFHCTVGMRISACDCMGKWYGAKVVQINDNSVRVRFDGWGDKFNEWIAADSKRLKKEPPPKMARKKSKKQQPELPTFRTAIKDKAQPSDKKLESELRKLEFDHPGISSNCPDVVNPSEIREWDCSKCTLKNSWETLSCELCGAIRPRDTKLSDNWRCGCGSWVENSTLQCPLCGQWNPTSSQARPLTSDNRAEDGDFRCGACNRSFRTEAGLKSHYKSQFHKDNVARLLEADTVEEEGFVAIARDTNESEYVEDPKKADELFKTAIEIGKESANSWLEFARTGSPQNAHGNESDSEEPQKVAEQKSATDIGSDAAKSWLEFASAETTDGSGSNQSAKAEPEGAVQVTRTDLADSDADYATDKISSEDANLLKDATVAEDRDAAALN